MIDKIHEGGYFTISEFAGFVGLPISTLRHYDKVGVFQPALRAGASGNQRCYSPIQITTIKVIRILTEIGVSLAEVKKLVEHRTPEMLLKQFRKSKGDVLGRISSLEGSVTVMDTYVDQLHEGISIEEAEIAVHRTPATHIRLGDLNDYDGTVGFVREFVRFCNSGGDPGLNTSFPIGGYWDSMGAFLGDPSRPARFFSLDPNGREQKAAGGFMIGYTRGYYGVTNDLPQRLVDHAKENGYVFDGPVFNTYLFDEISIDNPDQYLLQVSASVAEGRHAHHRSSRHLF